MEEVWKRGMVGIRAAANAGADSQAYGFDAPRVEERVFVPVIWAMIGFSFLFLPFRFWTRWHTFGRFFSDDAFVLLAWLCSVAMGALAVYMVDAMYWTMALTSRPMEVGKIEVGDALRMLSVVRKYSHGTNISFMLMYTSLWLVKLSFLLFFYRLGPRLISEMKCHWWAVATFTLLSYGATFTTYPYMCSFGSLEQVSSPYCMSQQNKSFVNMKVNTALDVVTDVAIMTIPLNILRRSRIPLRQSLALGGVFSLVLVTITFAVVRATVSTVGVTKQMDSPWVLVWSTAEASIAIIVACIGSFRMLFVRNKRDEQCQHRVWVGRGRRDIVVEKTSECEASASVEEMRGVRENEGEMGRGEERRRVESTMGSEMLSTYTSTMESTLASESVTMSGSNGWRSTQSSWRSR